LPQPGAPKRADHPANLWEPADGPEGRDFGPYGLFGDRSYRHSPQVWASQHHGAVAAAGLAAVAGAFTLVRAVRR